MMPALDAPNEPNHWPTTLRALTQHRRTLMLQGPIGWFFERLAEVLVRQGQVVHKVHFNGGDELFWRRDNASRYTGSPEAFGDWLRGRLETWRIDAVVLFGQMRPHHEAARRVAAELGVTVFVFEEGYLRPNFVTLERRGVNALSRLPRSASFYARQDPEPLRPPDPTAQSLGRTAWLAMAYYLAANAMRPVYRGLHHHRSLNPLTEGLRWVRSGVRRVQYALAQRGMTEWLCAPERSRTWFLVPLQVRGDSQITHHSRFAGMPEFITEVMTSFAAGADRSLRLVIKHHPMDRAYTHYGRHIRREAERLGLTGRVHYLHDQHLPTLLDHARGVVTVNSTVGLQALHHGAPVITLGESVYGIPGLVYPGRLDTFWSDPGRVDAALYQRFRHHLITHTQINASFYAEMPALRLPPPLAPRAVEPRPLRTPVSSVTVL